jgi:glycogen(starch) synthase
MRDMNEPADRSGSPGVVPTSRRIVIHTPEPQDGAAQYVSELVAALAGIGLEVVLFCPENFKYAQKVREAGVAICASPERVVSTASLASRLFRNFQFLAGAALSQMRLARRRDIFHFQNTLHLPLGFVFYLLVKLQGGSIMLTAHDPLPHRWRFSKRLKWLERAMLGRSYRMCKKIVVHNERGKEILEREFQIDPARIAVIPHGPFSAASTEHTPYPEFDSLRLLAFGAIRENKGLHLAIEAVQIVNRASNIPVYLTIAGRAHTSAEEQYWSQCQKLIALTPELFEVDLGYVPDEKVSGIVASHHAVILPYQNFFSESGVAALALSHDRPIIATTAGGLGELLRKGLGGISIDSPTVEAVVDAIQMALQIGPRVLLQRGINGRKFVTEARSWDWIARQTAKVYGELGNATGLPFPPSTLQKNSRRAAAAPMTTAGSTNETNFTSAPSQAPVSE